jgi:hypothetical protein
MWWTKKWPRIGGARLRPSRLHHRPMPPWQEGEPRTSLPEIPGIVEPFGPVPRIDRVRCRSAEPDTMVPRKSQGPDEPNRRFRRNT